MTFTSFGDFTRYLESCGELVRTSVEVDPALEITAIASRALRESKPAILFERVKGSPYPVVVNALASDRRCELALGRDPGEIGEDLIRFFEEAFPPKFAPLVAHRSTVSRFLHTPVRIVRSAPSQEVTEEPDLDRLPVLTCWPEDGGRFITLPQVVTYDPVTGKRNMGMYRMQVFDARTTGMHWQIQKGGGFHYAKAEKLGRPLELAVAIGTDPALILATVAPLPENIDEAMFAGFLRGKRTEFARGRTVSIAVPASAEFVLEGIVQPGERRMEGPFGDHFGHYSAASEFPVFHVSALTRRRNPVFPATVVGIPPMEDKFLGDATQRILSPLVRLLHAEVTAMWAYYEAGFHNLLVVAVDQRYAREAMKTALGLMGMSQLALTKCIILVSEGVDVRNFSEVLGQVRDHFDPHGDFVMIPRVPLDTLDFTSARMNLGSKMILDATHKERSALSRRKHTPARRIGRLHDVDRRILDETLIDGTMLVVRVSRDGRQVLGKLLRHPPLAAVPLIVTVSDDVDIRDRENTIWGIFTRFDCERDVLFAEQRLIGIAPVYGGAMGIDATWKKGYPAPLAMSGGVTKRVEERWESYWRS
ncbi:MAG TPA: menaquinone biosynthesis decarboxylase [Bacteroidota bacterium]|nr:menaquinone biosynthesis decarboxylase [Bacteroidota bacterium]